MQKKHRILIIFLIIIFGFALVVSVYKITEILLDHHNAEKSYEMLKENFVVAVDTEESNVETAPISVDFETLKIQNSDIIGWIYCEDTPINYPILQSEDNNFYLRRLANKKYSSSGSIFLDYRCNPDLSSLNTIIYGHNMKNDTMFGTFNEYKEQSYYDEYPILWLLTPKQNYKIELIAGYVTPSTSDVYKDFYNQDELDKHIKDSVDKSTFVSGINIAEVDRIVTLSTCSYEYSNARYVLIGNLKGTH